MRYAILFEVNILHDYYLNVGRILHEALSEDQQSTIRRQYSVDAFLEVTPTLETERTLAGHGMIFKSLNGV